VDHWRELIARVGIRIDLIIHPETELADRIMRIIRLPGVFDVREFAGGEVRLAGLNLEPGNPAIGRSLEQLMRAGPPSDALVAMIFRGPQVIIPRGGEVLREGDSIYVAASRRSFDATLRFMGLAAQAPLRRVFVLGGKQLGIAIAGELERQGVQVKLFERDAGRSERIASVLARTTVIGADGLDEATLEDAGIADAGAFLALTGHDEDNVIAALLARRLGVPKVVALINRLNYHSMVQRLGINTTVSPRLAAVDRILQFVRKGRVMSVTTFGEEEAEAIEVMAGPDSKYVGRPLRELRFPRSSLIAAIVNPSGDVLVPRGDAVVQAGDRLIVFALERAVPQLEAAFLAPGQRGSA
jgi:trk system potassium uptake protein TrkA